MKKKTRYRLPVRVFSLFNTTSFLIAETVCIMLVIHGLVMFNRNSMMILENTGAVPVGIVTEKSHVSRRRFEKRNLWGILSKNSYIYNGDLIFTDKNSQVKLQFDNGVELTLLENTMTQISFGKDNELKIGLDMGNLIIDSKRDDVVSTVTYNRSDVTLNTKGSIGISEVKPGNSGAGKSGDSSASYIEIMVFDGTAGLTSGERTVELVANQKMQLAEVESAVVENVDLKREDPFVIIENKDEIFKSSVVSLNEENNSRIMQKVSVEINENAVTTAAASGRTSGSVSSTGPDTSGSSSSIFSSYVFTGNNYEEIKSLQDNLNESYVRANTEGKGTAALSNSTTSEDSQKNTASQENTTTSVVQEKPVENKTVASRPALAKPSLSSPAAGKVFNDSYFLENSSINFKWNSVQEADAYVFFLKDSRGRILLEKEVGKTNQYQLSDFSLIATDTNFTWCVRAVRKSNGKVLESKESSSSSFKIRLGEISGEASVSGNLYGR